MSPIYDQFDKAFANVSAFVILDANKELVAKVAIKFPRDGAGRLYAYVHLIGVEMVRGHANGYGYDKRSAAVAHAIGKIKLPPEHNGDLAFDKVALGWAATLKLMSAAVPQMDRGDWTRALEAQGFTVVQAV